MSDKSAPASNPFTSRRSRSSSCVSSTATSETARLNDLSLDLEGVDLIDIGEDHNLFVNTSVSQSIASYDSEFNRELRNQFDNTLSTSDIFYEFSDHSDTNSPEHSDSYTDSRPSSRSSVTSVINMAPTYKDRYMKIYKTALLMWEDTYEGNDASLVLPDEIGRFITELGTFIGNLREVMIYFDETPCAEFGADELRKCKETQAAAVALRKIAEQRQFRVAQEAQTAADAAAQAAATASANASQHKIAVDRVAAEVARLKIAAMEDTVMSAAGEIVTSYDDLTKTTVSTTGRVF